MRVGLDIRILYYSRTGFYRYVKGLLESMTELDPEDEVVLLQHPGFRPPATCFSKFQRIDLNAKMFANDEAAEFNREIAGHGFDLIHFPCSLSLPLKNCKVLVTLHDLTCIKYPQTMQDSYRSFYLNTLTKLSLQQNVCVVSNTVMNELAQIGYHRDRTFLVYPATPFVRRKPRQPARWNVIETQRGNVDLQAGKFILSVGATEPRKNLAILLRSYGRLRTEGRHSPHLVVVSQHGWDDGELARLISQHPFQNDIHVATRVEDDQLGALYSHCAACVFTSFYEGFGFVPLEALHHGAPLISSATPSLVEAGYPAEDLNHYADYSGFATKMESACTNRTEFLKRQSAHARKVSHYYRTLSSSSMVGAYHQLLHVEKP